MNYLLNPDTLGEIFAVPAAVADEHIKLAGSAQLKVLLWLLRGGQGAFDAELCSKATGISPVDCCDALQYWFATGLLLHAESDSTEAKAEKAAIGSKKAEIAASVQTKKSVKATEIVLPRPRPVKPTMKEVIDRQKKNSEFAYLLDTVSSRMGRPISNGDMETLLYLYETAGLPVEVILMVIEYAIAEGKSHMRYIEKVALDWSDRGLDTIAAAEAYLCELERRREAWNKLSTLLGLKQSPTVAQSEAAECWIFDWQVNHGLLVMAYEICRAATGKFNSGYINKVIEQWRADGIDTPEKAKADRETIKQKSKNRPKKETSFDLDEYETMVQNFTPVYTKKNGN